jgi:hypothetical protein
MPEALDLTKANFFELLAEQNAAAADTAAAKERTQRIKQELASRFRDSALEALKQVDKTHGTTTLPLQDGFAAKAEVKQTVKWDSAKLQAVAQTLPWERVIALFKIDFSMSETLYKGVAALSPELRKQIDAARTTTIAEPVITLAQG